MARYAIVIGSPEYGRGNLNRLAKAEGDAEAVAALLQEYGQCQVELTVLKGRVTRKQLVTALKEFLNEQAAGHKAIIYFTGHGISVINRRALLTALPDSRRILLKFGGDEAFTRILQAIKDIC